MEVIEGLVELATEEHRQAELLRLRAGFEGCGCTDCQEFYTTIDLSLYGERVKRYGDATVVLAGETGADLWETYHPPEPSDNGGKPSNQRKGVTKPNDKEILPTENPQAQTDDEVLLQKNKGGRPRKTEDEEVSRMTTWRRQKEKQGVLL